MSYQKTTALAQTPVIASKFIYTPAQTNARKKIALLKKLAEKETDKEISVEFRRTANNIYRTHFGYDPQKLKARIVEVLFKWKECGLTEKEIAEELKISKADKPRSDFENAFIELIGEGKVFVLHTPDMPHQFGDHSYEVYSVK